MDAYDQIQKEALSPDRETPGDAPAGDREVRPDPAERNDLGTELKEAYTALSSSAWGVRLGGFFGQVVKQGESYYEGARTEITAAGAEASKGWTDLVSKTQALGIGAATSSTATTGTTDEKSATGADITEASKETETILSRLKSDAAARLKQIQQAEDAADEALERFGTNLKNFLRDAVSVKPPSEDDVKSSVLFESKDSEGKRVVHATRFDAQLHAIHSNTTGFLEDPKSDEFATWKKSLDIEQKTDAIAKDLDKYPELRRSMDSLVPEKVPYADFWTRYYFLRHVVEVEEQRRRDLLKDTQKETEEVAWDDDDDDENINAPRAEGDSGTKTPTTQQPLENKLLRPGDPRRSNEHSVADSDASYDLVSGAPSQGPGTPREEKDIVLKKKSAAAAEQSDEEDWE